VAPFPLWPGRRVGRVESGGDRSRPPVGSHENAAAWSVTNGSKHMLSGTSTPASAKAAVCNAGWAERPTRTPRFCEQARRFRAHLAGIDYGIMKPSLETDATLEYTLILVLA